MSPRPFVPLERIRETRCDWTLDNDQRCERDAAFLVPEFANVLVCKRHALEFENGVRIVPFDPTKDRRPA